jgi:hypothetical protein
MCDSEDTCLHVAVRNKGNAYEASAFLVANGAGIGVKNAKGMSPLE